MEFNKVLTVVYQGSKLTLLMTYSLVLIHLLSVTYQGSGVSKGSLGKGSQTLGGFPAPGHSPGLQSICNSELLG